MRKFYFAFAFFLLLLGGIVQCKESSFAHPSIKFNKEIIELGNVKEGVIINRSLTLKNVGNEKLILEEVKSTCGCTVPAIKKMILAPGESTTLRIAIDTAMKQDKVIKTVDVNSNDPFRPKVVLSISMIVENKHKNLKGVQRAKILSDEGCMSCHVYKGVGAFGKDLFDADCAMCHGIAGEGASGPNLIAGGYKNEELVKARREIIACGSKSNNSMPGFEYTCKGPLSKEQVDSLIEYLKSISESQK